MSNVRYATTNMAMPAMSPTMTEGGIASWKKNEGESFAAGDVLLEVASCFLFFFFLIVLLSFVEKWEWELMEKGFLVLVL